LLREAALSAHFSIRRGIRKVVADYEHVLGLLLGNLGVERKRKGRRSSLSQTRPSFVRKIQCAKLVYLRPIFLLRSRGSEFVH
jgi:hypothetical protein